MIIKKINLYACKTVTTIAILILLADSVIASTLPKTEKNPNNTNAFPDIQRLLVVGDSLSAGFGLAPNEGWTSILKQRLADEYHVNVINASISGETTLGGMNRIQKLLEQHSPSVVIIELGGNDGLRGLPLADMKDNLRRIITTLQKRNIRILLVGMKLPPNYGKQYTREFYDVYIQLAKEYNVALVPFMLEGIANNWDMMQADGIHPRAEAQSQILSTMWPYIQRLLPKVDLK